VTLVRAVADALPACTTTRAAGTRATVFLQPGSSSAPTSAVADQVMPRHGR
jgi:hypothetical protein